MRAMASEYEVIRVQVVSHSDSGSLLAGRKVGRARIAISHAIVAAGSLHEVEHGLELTDVAHVTIYS